jgi:hypothetical protein
MPESLHAELARASDRAGMSLNAFITQTLSAAVEGRSTPASRSAPTRGRHPRLDRLLVANLIVVAIVGVLAAVLLVQAIR